MVTEPPRMLLTTRDLRRRWKPHKERLTESGSAQSTAIRFHRACSWLDRAESADEDDFDSRLIHLWIAFNSLYGQWDKDRREPENDRKCWKRFVDHVLRIDQSDIVVDTLQQQKPLVLSLLEDDYLNRYFWQDPELRRGRQGIRARRSAFGWYVEKSWTIILDQTLERVYLARCQLVHGAATHGGQLNRAALGLSQSMMQHLIQSFLLVWIDFGADEDWGPLCYPPIRDSVNDGSPSSIANRRPR